MIFHQIKSASTKSQWSSIAKISSRPREFSTILSTARRTELRSQPIPTPSKKIKIE